MEQFLTKNGIIVLTKPSKWSDNSGHQGYSIPFLIRNALQEISTVCFFFQFLKGKYFNLKQYLSTER